MSTPDTIIVIGGSMVCAFLLEYAARNTLRFVNTVTDDLRQWRADQRNKGIYFNQALDMLDEEC